MIDSRPAREQFFGMHPALEINLHLETTFAQLSREVAHASGYASRRLYRGSNLLPRPRREWHVLHCHVTATQLATPPTGDAALRLIQMGGRLQGATSGNPWRTDEHRARVLDHNP
jgi:hypothetical protein